MKYTKSAGGVIVNPDGKVLVVSQHGTSWSLAKGKLEDNEDEKEAMRREFKEEAGLTDVTILDKLGTYERLNMDKDGQEDPSEHKTITFYLCTTKEDILAPEDPENPEAKWVDPEEVTDLLTHPKDKEFYQSVKNQVVKYISARV